MGFLENTLSVYLGNFGALSNMRNFLTRNFSQNCECYVLFESAVFEIKELQQRSNKNWRTGIDNQK